MKKELSKKQRGCCCGGERTPAQQQIAKLDDQARLAQAIVDTKALLCSLKSLGKKYKASLK